MKGAKMRDGEAAKRGISGPVRRGVPLLSGRCPGRVPYIPPYPQGAWDALASARPHLCVLDYAAVKT